MSAVSVQGEGSRILFVSLANDVGSERVVAEMANCGAECGLVSPSGFYSTALSKISRHFLLPPDCGVRFSMLFVRRRLEQAVRDWGPALILPLDDLSSWLLRCLAIDVATSVRLQAVLVASLGCPSSYFAAINRCAFMDRVEELGLPKPRHCAVTSLHAALAAARQWGFPIVVKTEHTSGGIGVTIAYRAEQLAEHLNFLNANGWLHRSRRRLKNWLYHRAVFGLDEHAPAIIQSYIPGIPAFRTVAAWKGRVLAGVSFVAEQVNPETTGASTVVRHTENAAMEHSVTQIVAALGCSGFVSFDFVLDTGNESASVIEMNARSVGTTHLGRLFGHDACGELNAILAKKEAHSALPLLTTDLVALFPKELERNPTSPFLNSPLVYHDVPTDEPLLVNIYLNKIKARRSGTSNAVKLSQRAVRKPRGQRGI